MPYDPELGNEEVDRDHIYDNISDWISEHQGNDTDYTSEEIREWLEEHDVLDEEGNIDENAIRDALEYLDIEYEGFDETTWMMIGEGGTP